jgi:spermidine/putrescine ABC transporter ATP-binding subunit
MVSVELKGVTKSFQGAVVVNGLSLDVKPGEFFTLLGPSGCGKTTTLRLIAGFLRPDAGQILFSGRNVTTLPPSERNVGIVFQNYALWPHMTVFENIAYGLKVRRFKKDEIRDRVASVMGMLGLAGLEEKFPSQLSGGQQQRVALARTLVVEPTVLLLDEPLSNLDAVIRTSVREELRRLQRRLGITTIYVTHDQEEAMVLSDRVAVMNRGSVVQVGTPSELYRRPATEFVAQFVGSNNILGARLVSSHGDALVMEVDSGERLVAKASMGLPVGSRVLVCVRPEKLRILTEPGVDPPGMNVWDGVVRFAAYKGNLITYDVVLDSGLRLKVEFHTSEDEKPHKVDSRVRVAFKPEDCYILPG